MCFNTTDYTGKEAIWSNKLSFSDFGDDTWKKYFLIDGWNNSNICCTDPLVSPIYNYVNNVYPNNTDLLLQVTPIKTKDILAYSSSISSYRNDILYGSFRLSAKMPTEEGTSFGFFFFHNSTEEIDMEVLAHQQIDGIIRMSIQPIIRDSSNRASIVSQRTIDLPKALSESFIEYRFDWFKTRVDFFADGIYYTSLQTNIPTLPGKMVINHRTNGNPKWSRGPPVIDSVVEIDYLEFYFNSSVSKNCTIENYIEETDTNTSVPKYTSSIIVVSIFFFVCLVSYLYSKYSKYKSRSAEAINPINIVPIQEKGIEVHDRPIELSIVSRRP